MAEFAAETVLHRAPEAVHDTLVDFSRYPRYSEYLQSVEADGDGGPGTEYRLRFAWWKVGYTVRSRVTAVERPGRIAFELIRGIDAEGAWHVEPAPEEAPEGGEASRVRFAVEYDPDSVGGGVDLPRLVSLDWVIRKAEPLIQEEAERVMERIAADLEGGRRDVDLTIET